MRTWPHVVWAVSMTAVVAMMLLGAARTGQPANQCSGIGWGCTLSGGDLAGLVAVVVVPGALGILLVGHGVIRAVAIVAAAWRCGAP